jgi:eukaryotic-like serine/threonine-protein kinase
VVGELIAGRYELEELVGSGGMASVYRAHDRLLERWVALKILHEHFLRDEDSVERFLREARSVAQLTHPNIVTVIDRGEQDGRPYIVFEYVEGENLKQLVARQGALPVPQALDLALQVARALEAAHDRGVVHRDVKPQNVLLAEEGRAKVTDFGIARARDTEGLTITGTILGTSDYIPPEQARGEPAGEAGDVYSLGVVLYELLTGEVPYEAENPVAVAMRHVHDPVPSVRDRRPDVPLRVDALVRRALAKSPQERFASMTEVVAELDACRRGDGPPPSDSAATVIVPPPAVPRRRRGSGALRTILLSVVALLLVAGAAVGAYVLTRGVESSVSGNGGDTNPAARVPLTAAGAYDPYGTGASGEHDADAPKAVDGDPTTYWRTETYRDGLAKAGVGLVLDAGAPKRVTKLTVQSDTPGFTAEIQDGTSSTGRFTTVSASRTVGATTTFTLSNATEQYYVVWITNLGPNGAVHVNEVRARN